MARGLLLIDIQNDYFRGGAMELVDMERAGDNAARLLASFRQNGEPIFHVQHISVRPEAGFFQPGTPGVEINERVKPFDGESLTQKNFPNAFRSTPIDQTIRNAGVDELVVCGAMSHMCIDATTRAAFDLGYTCTVAEDACATRDLTFEGHEVKAKDVHASFMAALGWVYAATVQTDAVLTA
jgi:nicotinamidase-related amidase